VRERELLRFQKMIFHEFEVDDGVKFWGTARLYRRWARTINDIGDSLLVSEYGAVCSYLFKVAQGLKLC